MEKFITYNGKLINAGGTSLLKINEPFSEFALDFGGTDERLVGSSTLSTFDGLQELSISFWVKGNNLNGFLFANKSSQGATTAYQQFASTINNTSSSIINFSVNLLSIGFTRGDTSSLLPNKWNHILWCYSSLGGKVYINGVDVTTISPSGGATLYAATSTFVIAGISPIAGGTVSIIDEFAIWGSDQRNNLSQIYNNGTPSNLNDLSTIPDHWWRMGENGVWDGTNWTIPDENGGYNLTTQNMEETDRINVVP